MHVVIEQPVVVPAPAQGSFYQAVAVDFDGTLTRDGRTPAPKVLAALVAARTSGLHIFLVTGRILWELEGVWPTVHTSVDCVVAENGAVVHAGRWHHRLAAPVNSLLDAGLDAAHVPYRRGEVLLATTVADEPSVLGCIRALQLSCETVANRSELMVVPAGVSKGGGLQHALDHFGLSLHNTIAIGDAENDLSLFQASELAVAVGDAVAPLQGHADLVLPDPNGEGVSAFLGGDVVNGRRRVHSPRWRLLLGASEDGRDVTVPASQMNILVTGGTGSGKSFVAGLLAEQLVESGYSILVIDPEGDHIGLGGLRNGLVIGGTERFPGADEVLRLLDHGYPSVVVDLSGLEPKASARYQRSLVTLVVAHRRQTGLPHWVFLDEADQALSGSEALLPMSDPSQKGYCLVTWRPEVLAAEVVAGIDAVVAVTSGEPPEVVVNVAAAIGDVAPEEVARRFARRPGSGVLVRRDLPHVADAFTVGTRVTVHLRHNHKYQCRPLDAEHAFHFRRSSAERTGALARSLGELEAVLRECDRSVLRHHCPRHDISRWVADVIHDETLSATLSEVETLVDDQTPAEVVDEARLEIIAALEEKLT